ncbi:MAG: alginate export family protein, partial [Ferruginibacter sp.]
MKKIIRQLLGAVLFFCLLQPATAQLTLTGQIRTRTELRDGLGTLKPATNSAAFFTSQRSRLTFNYKMNHIVFQTSLQDIRVWGQDASTISNADGSKLGVHEAWAEISLANKKDTSFQHSAVDYFGVKIGRQELLYDDSRLLGNLDWLQQARRHDAI